MDKAALQVFIRNNWIFLLFAALALTVRLVFWIYTGRIWEDALISLSAARSAWLGYGLTHHLSEPRVHSFTSALGEFILLIGEGTGEGNGLLAMRLASLAAAVAAIYCAFRIGVILGFHWAAQFMVLGYLATDHLQVFFGMSGMETQVATALILANIYFYLSQRWTALGLACGAALICRPEFAAWVVILGAAMLIQNRQHLIRVVLGASIMALPWLVFAQIYYGSVIPHTIVAKSESQVAEFSAASLLAYTLNWLNTIAPFYQYIFVTAAPVPRNLLHGVSLTLTYCALLGAVVGVRDRKPMWAVVLLLLAFLTYRTLFQLNIYFMWYLPPFVAVLFLLAGCGVTEIARTSRPISTAVALFLMVAYAMHLPFTLPLDRAMQTEIEEGVRRKVGLELARMMKPDETVFLEPLGFIGWEIPGRSTFDYPGLSSPKALAAYRASGQMAGMIGILQPDYAVLRPKEIQSIQSSATQVLDRYRSVETIKADPVPRMEWGGLRYSLTDSEFSILKHK